MSDTEDRNPQEEERGDKLSDRGIRTQSGFLKWLDNFWYHYKWQTILALFVMFAVIVTAVQCSHVESGDVTVVWAGNLRPSESESIAPPTDGLKAALSAAVPEDSDGSGKKQITFNQFSIYSEEQLRSLYTYKDEETGESRLDSAGYNAAKSYNANRMETLRTYIMTGECAVWIVSPYVYEQMFEGKVRVKETCCFGDTAFYKTYSAVNLYVPEDALLVLVHPTIGSLSEDENFVTAENYYHSIVNFVPAG